MSWPVFIIASCLKVLLIPSYKSTDFEVHRNWLALTSSLPHSQWYTEATSPWTLDYPPFFAWFEYLLSLGARHVDPAMLQIQNLDYASWRTVLFQRFSVIITDLVLFLGCKSLAEALPKGQGGRHSRASTLTLLIMSNAGLLMVDHVHFQYNGLLTGILLLTIASLARDRVVSAAVWFSVLLHMKHIYLYYAPAVGIYMLRSHCFQSTRDGRIIWRSFSLFRLLSLAVVVLATSALSLVPFIQAGQLPHMLSRLFPFKRGLCHAYWAPNFWALYNVADKGLAVAGKRLGYLDNLESATASMTGGLVQDISHAVLPSVPPFATAVITLLAILPAVAKLWLSPHSLTSFLRALTICAWSSFMFGWHVHEKAILLVIIPLAVLATVSRTEARLYLLTASTGHFSLFPLLFKARELPTKLFVHLSHSFMASQLLPQATLTLIDKLYLVLAVPVFLYSEFLHSFIGLSASLPFLPLLLYSLYSAVGITVTYLNFYANYLKS